MPLTYGADRRVNNRQGLSDTGRCHEEKFLLTENCAIDRRNEVFLTGSVLKGKGEWSHRGISLSLMLYVMTAP